MNPFETTELLAFIRGIHERYKLTLIVVEHDMSLIMRLCDRIQVLNFGQTICEDSPDRVRGPSGHRGLSRHSPRGGQRLSQPYKSGDKDFSAQLTKIKNLQPQPDFVFVSAIPDDIGTIVKRARDQG